MKRPGPEGSPSKPDDRSSPDASTADAAPLDASPSAQDVPRLPRLRVRVHTLDSIRHRDYRLVLAASTLSNAAFWLYRVVVGWLAYDMTRSPLLTSLVQGLDHLPFLVLGLFAGVLVDAWDRRKIVASAAASQAGVILLLALVVNLGRAQPWHLIAFVLAAGVGMMLSETARFALIANVVPRRSLFNAIALNNLTFNVTRLAIPALTGLTILAIGAGHTLMLGVAILLGVSAASLLMRKGGRTQDRTQRRASFSLLVRAARFLRGEPKVLTLVLLGAVPAVTVLPFIMGLMPVYAAEVFHVGPGGLGLLVSAVGVGASLGTLTLASLGGVKAVGRVLVLALAAVSASLIGFALSPTIYLAIPVLVLYGGALMTFFTVLDTSIQMAVPDEIRGTVTALSFMSIGLMPAGSVVAGSLAELLGAPGATLVAGSALALVLTALSIRSRYVWRLTTSGGHVSG